MEITVNGDPLNVEGPSTVIELLKHLGLGDTPVAVERNRVIVPRAEHATTRVEAGDELELVHFVGGG